MPEQEKTMADESGESQRLANRRLIPEIKTRESILIGRGIECDVVIKDVKASRKHCRLTRAEGGFVLEDLESRNGTFVEGKRIEGSVKLKPSQTFKVGDTVFYLAP
jgi:pSer/pThr/pTyr-binding forkhead associated (FHA) protein